MQLAGTILNYVYNIPNCTIILVIYTAYCDFYKCGPRTLQRKVGLPCLKVYLRPLGRLIRNGRYQVDIKWGM